MMKDCPLSLSRRSLTVCQAFNSISKAAKGLKPWNASPIRSAEPKVESLTKPTWRRQMKPWIESWISRNLSCASGCKAQHYWACWPVVNSTVQRKWVSFSSMKAIAKWHQAIAPVTARIALPPTNKRCRKSINTGSKWQRRSSKANVLSKNECCGNTKSRRAAVSKRIKVRNC